MRLVFVTTMCFYGLTNHHLMFNVEFVHWLRKASIGELGGGRGGGGWVEMRKEERRGSSHHRRELGNRTWGLTFTTHPLHTTPRDHTHKKVHSNFLSFFLWEAKVTLINPWCPNARDTWRHMRKCGVLGSCIIFMCIRVYIEERKKHKSPYRPYFMLTLSLVPPYPNLSRLPRALFAGTPLHMFCALFLFVSPCVVQGKKWATTTYGYFSSLFVLLCLPPPTPFNSDSTNIYRIQYVVLIVFWSSSTSMKNWTTLNPKVRDYANGSHWANQK